MKKLLCAAALGCLIASCGSKSDPVRDLAEDFAIKASDNMLDSIRSIYPDAAKADSLALSFATDSMRITETANPGTYTVQFNPTASITIVKDADGNMKVSDSHGIFAYPDSVFETAKATGQWDTSLTDAENASRMADTDFMPYLINQVIRHTAKNFKASQDFTVIKYPEYGMDMGLFEVTVNNDTDHPIDASDYNLYIVYHYMHMGVDERTTAKVDGKAVPPHSSVTFREEFSGHSFPEKAYVNTTMNDSQLFRKYFTPTGKEYTEYIESKNKK